VIVILGILLAIAIPALTGYIGKAGSVKKEADLNTSVKAIQTWAAERLAQNLIGQIALVVPDAADPLENASDPVDPASYGGTTDEESWEGIVASYSKLDLRTGDWRLVNVAFDSKNKLLSLRIINTKDISDFADYGEMPYDLFYSEGGSNLTSLSHIISLTSPAGYPTVRYFTASEPPAGGWQLNAGSTGAALIPSGASASVSIPAGATGMATLTADSYTITFDVQASRQPSKNLKRGDTFAANGYDWRILHKESDADVLVIAEHIIDAKSINYPSTNWDTDIRWDGSTLRASLNSNTYAYSYDNLTDIKAKILDTTLYTRIGFSDARTAPYKTGGASDSGHNGYYELTNQKLFFLSQEEVFRALDYPATDAASMDLTKNLYGSSVVLFADANARKTSGVNPYTLFQYWLRSPRGDASSVIAVLGTTGLAANYNALNGFGVRPAFRMDLS
jgi:type II secretory pathway pseudopilin PulG